MNTLKIWMKEMFSHRGKGNELVEGPEVIIMFVACPLPGLN
jgi:hypothetical protein